VSEDSHALTRDPAPCPSWCADRPVEGTSDHPPRHEGNPLVVATDVGQLFAQATLSLVGDGGRIVLGLGDDEHAALASDASRSLAATLTRLADLLEGLSP
jgi:hypothetical protein